MNEQPNTQDIAIRKLSELKWDKASAEGSLSSVYEHVIRLGTDAANWYVKAKRPKQHLGYALRLWAIIFTAGAGIIPVLAEIWKDSERLPKISPGYASVLLLFSALFIFLDQFLGCSSGWMRYIKAHMVIKNLLEQLEFAFALERASWQGEPPTPERVQQTLARLRDAAAKINDVVLKETNEWAAEFKSALRQIEEANKAATEKADSGGINLVVTNGAQCTAGWQVTISDTPPQTFSGKHAALAPVPSGLCRLVVEGKIKDAPKRAECAVMIASGQVAMVEVTLA